LSLLLEGNSSVMSGVFSYRAVDRGFESR